MKIRSVTKMKGKKHTGYWKWGEIYALLFPGKVVPEERYVTVTAISQLSTEAQVGSRNPRGPGQDPLGDDPGEQRKRRPELRRQTLDFRPLPNNRMDEVRRDESQKIVEAVLAECSSRIFRLAASTDAPLVSQYPPCASEQGQRQSEPWREEFGYRLVSRIDEVLRDESQAIFRAVLAEQPQRWQQEFRHRLHGRIEEVQRDEGRGILPKVLTEHPSSLVFLQDTSADLSSLPTSAYSNRGCNSLHPHLGHWQTDPERYNEQRLFLGPEYGRSRCPSTVDSRCDESSTVEVASYSGSVSPSAMRFYPMWLYPASSNQLDQGTQTYAYQASRPDGIQNSISTPSGMIPSPAPGLLAVSNNTDISADWDIEAYEF
ncbi:unnamed protein product [Parascedosporium putredinis]|uniref:Uncharacterized protein n=1 Tax=Parascedosporium putredinis TaxID=1442378 RepID=A0A9P1GY41_9PEZI|nr:unnamed protein product [Parascedosporium putredinis]CAI7990377.1 unnamed protein product [Parascedosporium putredinis]